MNTKINWDTHIQSYLSSGLSVPGYCKQAGIKAHQFKYHYKKYRQEKNNPKISIESMSQMVPVKIKESVSKRDGDFEIAFPNGCRCLVSVPFNEEAISTIIKLLQS